MVRARIWYQIKIKMTETIKINVEMALISGTSRLSDCSFSWLEARSNAEERMIGSLWIAGFIDDFSSNNGENDSSLIDSVRLDLEDVAI